MRDFFAENVNAYIILFENWFFGFKRFSIIRRDIDSVKREFFDRTTVILRIWRKRPSYKIIIFLYEYTLYTTTIKQNEYFSV